MTVKELKEFLSQYNDDAVVLINKSPDNIFNEVRHLTESDITKYSEYNDDQIIIGYDT